MNEIPKRIHYCWFGRTEYPDLVKKCMKTWKDKLPDYDFMLWNEDNFDFSQNAWCRQAYADKKYAFVADYVRLSVLYQYGGIYLDTDIKVEKSFNNLLNQDSFIGFEDGRVISAGVIAAHPHNTMIGELMKYYDKEFIMKEIVEGNIPIVKALTQEFQKYGLKTDNTEQYVRGFHVYPRTYFNPMDYFSNWDWTKNSYCIHLYMGSWLPDAQKKILDRRKKLIYKVTKGIYLFIKDNKLIQKLRKWLGQKGIV